MKRAFVSAVGVVATTLALAGCSASATTGPVSQHSDVRTAVADAIAACGAWRQYAEPENGQPPRNELLSLAESDAHSAAGKSDEYARLGVAIHDAVHRLVPTGGATSAPTAPVPSEVIAAATEACDQVPRENEPQ